MLSLSKTQKKILTELSGGRTGKWTAENAVKAIHVVYGNKVTFVKFIEPFHGNNTKTMVRCNLCGKLRCTALRSILYSPTCPRCHFKGDCARLSYPIIQERLIQKGRPILIFPYFGIPYKNNGTHFLAYDYAHHETWDTTASRLSEGKGAPNYKHKMGYKKEEIPLNHYKRTIKHAFHNHIVFHVLHNYIGRNSLILAYDKLRHDYLIITINHLLERETHAKYRFIHRSLPYLRRRLQKRFQNDITVKYFGEPLGFRTHIVGNLYGKSFDTTIGNLLNHTDSAVLTSNQLHALNYFNAKYGKAHFSIESQISRAKFGYAYNHQNNIYIPHIAYIMKHYSAKLHFRAFGLHDSCGHNSKKPWIEYPDLLHHNWNTPIANIKKRNKKKLLTGLHAFIHWYKNQHNIYIPAFKRIVRKYFGNRMIVHCICRKCGYGKGIHQWTETINKLLNGT